MSTASTGGNIVAEWLRSLRLARYADGFLDNGYDDLEICKQIGEPDLDAIGVLDIGHRARLLRSVRTLREEGAASVYFTLEESDECLLSEDRVSVASSSAKENEEAMGMTSTEAMGMTSTEVMGMTSTEYRPDEYEEGKAELVRIPRMRLKGLLREKLDQDGIALSCQPYSTKEGDRGYLEGLASRYADLFSTHYVDVLGHLEDLRRLEWAETSSLVVEERPAPLPSTPPQQQRKSPPTSTTTSMPLYAPGKYSPSSCLSDKEEDEIYGFGYGVFATQIARQQQQQQRLLGQQQATSHQPLLLQQHHNYQTCLSPRSAYFYEFPPNADQSYTNTGGKKRTTFSRFLRGLKTSHRKEKHGGASSPRHGRAAARGVPQRVDTPDSVLQSGLGLTDLGQHAVLRSMVDPRDFDRLRHLQMNGGTPNTFEETIYKLKLQEAMKKREKFTKEHEDILRDIKLGLLQLGKEGIRGPLSGDDTYMYDEDARMLAPAPHGRPAHWYDEPPYESDPEDFLMGGSGGGNGPTATYRNGRVCFTLNLRQDQSRGEGVISLRSAGDITLPRETPRRGLILPSQAGYPPAIIPLRSSRDRGESGDYAGSDVQSIGSRLSGLSVDTSRSDPHRQTTASPTPRFYTHHQLVEGQIRHFHRKASGYSRSEDGISPGQSSDYEDHDDFGNCSQQIATVHVSSESRTADHLVRGLVGDDVHRKMSRLRNDDPAEQVFQCSASSVESLPSGSGSSTQALVRAGSNHSSISTEEADPSPTDQIVGRARAVVDQTPSPYDSEALKFKAGDMIDIVSMNASGQWRGICRGRKGTFKFINVELVSERAAVKAKRSDAAAAAATTTTKWHRNISIRPASVEDLLMRIGLHDYISVFVLNGYEDLELFKELEPSDLDYLGVVNAEHRSKLLAAVHFLHDIDSGSEGDMAGSMSSGDEQHRGVGAASSTTGSPFGVRRQFPRDSGCYDAPPMRGGNRQNHRLTSPTQGESDTSDSAGFSETTRNNLDSVVEQCNNEILARVKQAQVNSIDLKEELSFQPNIPAIGRQGAFEMQTLQQKKPKDSYVSVHGQTSLVDPCRKPRPQAAGRRKLEEPSAPSAADAEPKLTPETYSSVGTIDVAVDNANAMRSCLSEKSSDSGVSSSSLSSANARETRPAPAHAVLFAAEHGPAASVGFKKKSPKT